MPEVPDEPAGLPHDPGLPRATILVVDDDERNALALTTVLKELGQTLVVANSGEEALRYLLTEDVAVILLDVHMPGMDGYETAELIRARKRTRHIPIVFLTAVFRDDSHLLQAYSAGAVDMVFKPVDPFILKSKVSVFVDLYLKQAEIRREAELRSRLQEENFRVRTEKILAEQALRRSEERQEAILDSLPVCFHARSTEPPYAASFVSSNVEQLTGFPAQRFVDDPEFGMSRVHPEDVARVAQAFRDAVTTGAYSCEFRWRCADDSFRVLLDQGVLAPPEEGRRQEIFGTILDITDQRLLQQQLVQAQKMEAVGQLTGGIAHDFNNLLTVVLGNIDLLGRRFAADERVQRQLAAMRHAAERGQSLTGQLLAFSRRQHLRPESLDVSALVRGFEPLIRRAIGENIAVEITIGEDPAVCEVDASQLETTLLNLAVNARDAMPDGGTLRIAVRRIDHDADLMVRHSDATPGPWIALSIDDNGCGMPREVLNRAFEPFFTTKEPGKGSGLGLSQVYGFVRQSGGFVTLTSHVGAGTQLSIYLPPSSKPMAVPRFIPPAAPAARTRSETVLLVEDDAAVLAVGIEMLTDLGYRVITASDAGGALEILRRGRPVDLIFTDVVMPGGKTGVQLADEARALRPQIKVLLTSGYTGEALARHQPNHSDWPIIAKPFRQPDLAASIRKILESDALPA
jgi:signal transduction histidine kinase/response regulator RpfG family c-di-GMP phosphodiesterase